MPPRPASPPFLKDNFSRHSVLVWYLFFLLHFEDISPFPSAQQVSFEKYSANLMGIYVIYHFSLVAFKILHL